MSTVGVIELGVVSISMSILIMCGFGIWQWLHMKALYDAPERPDEHEAQSSRHPVLDSVPMSGKRIS